jgi:hypothetical protein
MPRSRRAARTAVIGLDSLVDIVSNTVGILIILAVFMALVTRLELPQAASRPRAVPLEPPPKRILVPWSHATTKSALFGQVSGNRVQVFDLREFYSRLAERQLGPGDLPAEVRQPGLETRFYPVTNYVYCLEFRPEPGQGETAAEWVRPGSAWNRVLGQYPPEKFFYFFWVAGDSFETFRDLRRELWSRQIEVGWKPAPRGRSLEVCNGFDGSTAFQPQ